MGNSPVRLRRRLVGGMPTPTTHTKPSKRKVQPHASLSITSTKRFVPDNHDDQVYLPVQKEWVDIQMWVQHDDHFCLNVAPFFVDTWDGYQTSCIGVSGNDYFPAMKVCHVGASRVLDPHAPTEVVYNAMLILNGRLCVRSAPRIQNFPKFAYLTEFEVIEAIDAGNLEMASMPTTKEALFNNNKNVYDDSHLTNALLMYSSLWDSIINEWVRSEQSDESVFDYRVNSMLTALKNSQQRLDLYLFMFSPIENDVREALDKDGTARADSIRRKLLQITEPEMRTCVRIIANTLIAILDKAFVEESQVSSSPRILYRGLTIKATQADLSDNCYSKLFDTNGVCRVGGYISTSTDLDIALWFKGGGRCCILAIHVQDVPSLNMEHNTHHAHENEVLLSRFTQLQHMYTVRHRVNHTIMHHVKATYLGPPPIPTCDFYTLASIQQYSPRDDNDALNDQRLDLGMPNTFKGLHTWFAHQANTQSTKKRHRVVNGLLLARKQGQEGGERGASKASSIYEGRGGGGGGGASKASSSYGGQRGGSKASSSHGGQRGGRGGGGESKASSSYEGRGGGVGGGGESKASSSYEGRGGGGGGGGGSKASSSYGGQRGGRGGGRGSQASSSYEGRGGGGGGGGESKASSSYEGRGGGGGGGSKASSSYEGGGGGRGSQASSSYKGGSRRGSTYADAKQVRQVLAPLGAEARPAYDDGDWEYYPMSPRAAVTADYVPSSPQSSSSSSSSAYVPASPQPSSSSSAYDVPASPRPSSSSPSSSPSSSSSSAYVPASPKLSPPGDDEW